MQFELSHEDAHILRELLHDYLPELRLEVARTEARDFRHELLKRQNVCEHLVELLDQAEV
jgi:hypothetical protein